MPCVGCNTITVEQIACIFGMNRANCDTDTKVGGNFPRWPRTNKFYVVKLDQNLPNSSICVSKLMFCMCACVALCACSCVRVRVCVCLFLCAVGVNSLVVDPITKIHDHLCARSRRQISIAHVDSLSGKFSYLSSSA